MHHFEVLFNARDGERFYGLGQHQHGLLNQKGAVVELVQRNTEVSIPFLVSNLGYGLLWNHPGIGRVELGVTVTRWVSEATRQWDYWITAADDPADLLRQYGEVTGRTPMLPEWASGFWQCKLRYKTQDELLGVAREYKRRGLPLSVIVADYFHWTRQGEWKFDPQEWPDPGAMVAELDRLGVKLMVSIWPTVNPGSENYAEMEELGPAGRQRAGHQRPAAHLGQRLGPGASLVTYYDSTNPRARAYIWAKVRENYFKHGIRTWWLDACEPELRPEQPENLRYHLGPGPRSATSTRCCTPRASTRACGPRARRRSSACAGPRGRAASATARWSGPATSTRPSRTCAARSPPASTSACPASRGGPRTSGASRTATSTTRRSAS